MEIDQLEILRSLDEQASVKFTGKINIIAKENKSFLGFLLLKNGDVIHAKYQNAEGLKAFYQVLVAEASLEKIVYIVEPELINESTRSIHFPYSVLRARSGHILDEYIATLKYRPQDDLKLSISPKFLESDSPVSMEEFDVLCAMSDWNYVRDIYRHCKLLDFEITKALVSLRRKGALRVIASSAS